MTHQHIFALVLFASIQLSSATAYSQEPVQTRPENPAIHVGTFDSRAVAMAYYRSAPFEQKLQSLLTEFKQAKELGDLDKAGMLEKRGPELQDLMHKQGFGTWPVDNILETIQDQLPKIAKKADVDIIVSKWNLVYQNPDLKTVDVTDLMVEPFAPDEATRKVIREIQTKTPVPVDQLQTHQ